MFTLAVGMPGPFELMIILAIVLILFGAGKLPRVLSQMGKGVKAFKDGLSGQGDDDETAMDVTPDEESPKALDEKPASSEADSEAEDAEEIVSAESDNA